MLLRMRKNQNLQNVTSGKVEGGRATSENHLEALKTFKHKITNSTKRDKNVCPYRNLNVAIHSISQVEVSQCPSMNRQAKY